MKKPQATIEKTQAMIEKTLRQRLKNAQATIEITPPTYHIFLWVEK
jgi:hypothetical protein